MSSGLVFMVGGTPLCCYDSGHLVQYNQYANRLILIQGQKGQVPALITVSTKASSSSSKEELLCELFLKGEREREKKHGASSGAKFHELPNQEYLSNLEWSHPPKHKEGWSPGLALHVARAVQK